ncbi:sigma-70 family RNA polymerase sigma factor [Sorangium cellulosum]|uniref:sigma-70 family RNA polymerase sigma factor n=1 Tax=Sorangium cellulosum TaxID=56 RepID=UPI0002F06704|nr:sigma-70 family RNA polymerase sigma factor [Sorangium cellulosum]
MKTSLPIPPRREACRPSADAPGSRTRRRARSAPNEALHPAVSPSIEALWAERRFVAPLLRALHVPARDLEDLLQMVLLGAWEAIRARRYRPDPRRHPRAALRGWLHGIVWRQVSHYRDSACIRCEILLDAPLSPAGQAPVEIEGALLARAALREIAALPAGYREVLLAGAGPLSLVAWARRRRMNPNSAASRLRRARRALAERLASPRRPFGEGAVR